MTQFHAYRHTLLQTTDAASVLRRSKQGHWCSMMHKFACKLHYGQHCQQCRPVLASLRWTKVEHRGRSSSHMRSTVAPYADKWCVLKSKGVVMWWSTTMWCIMHDTSSVGNQEQGLQSLLLATFWWPLLLVGSFAYPKLWWPSQRCLDPTLRSATRCGAFYGLYSYCDHDQRGVRRQILVDLNVMTRSIL